MKSRTLISLFLFLVFVFNALTVSAQNTLEINRDRLSQAMRKRIDNLAPVADQSLPIPILFGVSPADLSPNFGDPRSGGRKHEGEDIPAPKGAPVVSPTEAVVLGVGTWPGAGKYVSTANPGGEIFVYMHLDGFAKIKPGDVLQVGNLIGWVGNTGNAAGGEPHLHFEIRRNGATDPFPRLTAEFSPAQKIAFAKDILAQAEDSESLERFLSTTYPDEFSAVIAEETVEVIPSVVFSIPEKDMEIGAEGADVAWLQTFLINMKTGPASLALSEAGSTGYFGTITKTALAEYQSKMGIHPASGYFGPITRSWIAAVIS